MAKVISKKAKSTDLKLSVSRSVLDAAFEVIFTTDDFLANVIAGGDEIESDVKLKKKCEKYLKWYKRHLC